MKTFPKALVVLFSLGVIGSAFVAACSSSSSNSGPCNQNPFACPAGQTCWAGNDVNSFACLPAGGGKLGEPCTALQGTPACGQDLACAGGVCASFCDPTNDASHGCPPGQTCLAVAFPGGMTTFNACVTPTVDAGPPDSGPLPDVSPPPPTEAGMDVTPPPPVEAGMDSPVEAAPDAHDASMDVAAQ